MLRFPYGEARELVMEILRHGAGVEVLAPPELRQAVADTLATALSHYRDAAAPAAPNCHVPASDRQN